MSLIRIRRARKQHWIDAKRGKPPKTLIVLLILVLGVIWYLGSLF
jgi:hypothetical protein